MKYKVLPEGVSGIIRQLRFSKLLRRAPKLSCSRREYVKPVNKFLHRNDFFLFIRIYKNVTFEKKGYYSIDAFVWSIYITYGSFHLKMSKSLKITW